MKKSKWFIILFALVLCSFLLYNFSFATKEDSSTKFLSLNYMTSRWEIDTIDSHFLSRTCNLVSHSPISSFEVRVLSAPQIEIKITDKDNHTQQTFQGDDCFKVLILDPHKELQGVIKLEFTVFHEDETVTKEEILHYNTNSNQLSITIVDNNNQILPWGKAKFYAIGNPNVTYDISANANGECHLYSVPLGKYILVGKEHTLPFSLEKLHEHLSLRILGYGADETIPQQGNDKEEDTTPTMNEIEVPNIPSKNSISDPIEQPSFTSNATSSNLSSKAKLPITGM